MPQIQLPIFPSGTCSINHELAFERRENLVWYFNGHLPVFRHQQDDLASFRFFTSQLIANGSASQSQISRAFGVPLVTVKRAYKIFREKGPQGFYIPKTPQRGTKLNAEILPQAQQLLDEGLNVPAISERLGVLPNTLHKAIRDGRLKKK